METVDTTAICRAVHPVLRRWRIEERAARDIANVVATSAEGYPFPTNLDLDQPVGSLVPQTEAELLQLSLDEDWDTARLVDRLEAQQARRRSQVGR
jgi:hypothetical protein